MGSLCPLVLPILLSLQVGVKDVHIEGAEVFSLQQIEGFLGIERTDSVPEDYIADRVQVLLTEYRDAGYLQTRIDWWFEEGVLHLAIEEGDLYRVGKIAVAGNRFFSSDYIMSDFQLKEGSIFSQSALEKDIERLLDRYEDSGFPFCTVRPEAPRLDEVRKSIRLTLRIDEGTLTRIESVQVAGNTQTKEKVILRELAIAEGEIYSRKRLQEGMRRLNQLDVLSVSDYELAQTRAGWVNAVFRVEESPSNSVEGALAWAPEAQLTGSVNLRADNLFGTLRSFSLQWVRRRSASYYLRLGYQEPWLFGAPLTGRFDFETEVEEASYTLHTGSAHVLSRTLDPFDLGIGVGVDRVIALTSGTPSSNGVWLQLTAGVDTRDSRIAPRRGLLYTLTAKGGQKWNYWGNREDAGFETKSYSARTRLTLANFVPFQKGLIYLLIAGGSLFTEDASTWEMFRLGGAGTVRGYREEQFVAEQVAWTNLEYRFFLGRSGWFAPFFDLGYYADDTSEWIYGWGAGMGLTSKIGVVTINYGLGREDSFGNGKVHIGALTSF